MTGDELRDARRARGWRQRDLAEALGVDQPTVSEMERGMREIPAEALERLGLDPPSREETREGEQPATAAPPGDVPPRDVTPPPADDGPPPKRKRRGDVLPPPRQVDLAELESRVLALIKGEEIAVAVAGPGDTIVRYETARIPGLADVVGMLNEFDGAIIDAHAVTLTKAWVNLAKENQRVRRVLEALTAGGAWRGVVTATAPVVLAILLNHGLLPSLPGLSFGATGEYDAGQNGGGGETPAGSGGPGWHETATGAVG